MSLLGLRCQNLRQLRFIIGDEHMIMTRPRSLRWLSFTELTTNTLAPPMIPIVGVQADIIIWFLGLTVRPRVLIC